MPLLLCFSVSLTHNVQHMDWDAVRSSWPSEVEYEDYSVTVKFLLTPDGRQVCVHSLALVGSHID